VEYTLRRRDFIALFGGAVAWPAMAEHSRPSGAPYRVLLPAAADDAGMQARIGGELPWGRGIVAAIGQTPRPNLTIWGPRHAGRSTRSHAVALAAAAQLDEAWRPDDDGRHIVRAVPAATPTVVRVARRRRRSADRGGFGPSPGIRSWLRVIDGWLILPAHGLLRCATLHEVAAIRACISRVVRAAGRSIPIRRIRSPAVPPAIAGQAPRRRTTQ